MNSSKDILNELFVDLFQHILYLEEQALNTRGVDLTISEIHVLDAVHTVKPPTMSNIAKDLLITIGSTTTAVKKLEAKGYVIRSKQEDDGRIVLVELTQKAKDALEVHQAYHREMVEEILGNLNKEEEAVLFSALAKIKSYFKI